MGIDSGRVGGEAELSIDEVNGLEIDWIVKGVVDGRRQGFLFVTASNRYRPDQLVAPLVTRAALVTKVLAGGIISVMGVPPGTGAGVRAGERLTLTDRSLTVLRRPA